MSGMRQRTAPPTGRGLRRRRHAACFYVKQGDRLADLTRWWSPAASSWTLRDGVGGGTCDGDMRQHRASARGAPGWQVTTPASNGELRGGPDQGASVHIIAAHRRTPMRARARVGQRPCHRHPWLCPPLRLAYDTRPLQRRTRQTRLLGCGACHAFCGHAWRGRAATGESAIARRHCPTSAQPA